MCIQGTLEQLLTSVGACFSSVLGLCHRFKETRLQSLFIYIVHPSHFSFFLGGGGSKGTLRDREWE